MKAFILSILLDLLKYRFILILIMENLSQADLNNNRMIIKIIITRPETGLQLRKKGLKDFDKYFGLN